MPYIAPPAPSVTQTRPPVAPPRVSIAPFEPAPQPEIPEIPEIPEEEEEEEEAELPATAIPLVKTTDKTSTSFEINYCDSVS